MPNPFERQTPRIGVQPKSKFDQLTGLDTGPFSAFQEFTDTLYDNPALQALGIIPSEGANLAIGPFSPAQRATRKSDLYNKLILGKLNKTTSPQVFNKAVSTMKDRPNISSYLNDISNEKHGTYYGSINWRKSDDEMLAAMKARPAGTTPTDANLFSLQVKPNLIDKKGERHEFGHLARWIQNPDSMVRAATKGIAAGTQGAYTPRYGYWLNPEEIRARAIASKVTGPELEMRKRMNPTSYPKNDYRNRIHNEISYGMSRSTPEQVQRFLVDLNKVFPWYDVDSRPGWQSLTHNTGRPITK